MLRSVQRTEDDSSVHEGGRNRIKQGRVVALPETTDHLGAGLQRVLRPLQLTEGAPPVHEGGRNRIKQGRVLALPVTPFPPWKFPPAISHTECLKAIEQAGGLSITHRGEPMYITEISTRNSHWWSGGQRLTEAVKCLLTKTTREILNFEHSGIAPSD